MKNITLTVTVIFFRAKKCHLSIINYGFKPNMTSYFKSPSQIYVLRTFHFMACLCDVCMLVANDCAVRHAFFDCCLQLGNESTFSQRYNGESMMFQCRHSIDSILHNFSVESTSCSFQECQFGLSQESVA